MNAAEIIDNVFGTIAEAAIGPHRIEFAVMDRTGDTKTIWDASKPEEVNAARDMFYKLTKPASQGGSGYAAFRVTDRNGEKGEQVREFDPSHERLIFAPPMQGG